MAARAGGVQARVAVETFERGEPSSRDALEHRRDTRVRCGGEQAGVRIGPAGRLAERKPHQRGEAVVRIRERRYCFDDLGGVPVLPEPDFSARHELRIAAAPAAVWEALQEIRLADTALSRALMGIRLLPAHLVGRRSRMVSGRLLEEGPVPVLGSDPGRSVVAGGVMQPWKLTGGDDPPALDAGDLRAFAQPGWVKAAFDFVLEPDGDGTRVSTETRVSSTDASTRARSGSTGG